MLRSVRGIQLFLFAAGFVILGYCITAWIDSRLRQSEGNRELDRVLSEGKSESGTKSETAPRAPKMNIPDGGLIGRVEIPKLHLSAVVFQGADSSILGHGVGHVAGTALPGQPGNVVLAAHRDTFFRGLRNIRKRDMVMVTTESGRRSYEVDSTEVVNPTEVSVLTPTVKPTLTLITCYPFYYVGHAPKRFIVRATETEPGITESGAGPLRASR